MTVGSYSKTGTKHKVNQDSFFVKNEKNECICFVADGMGGHNAGDVASKTAVEILSALSSTGTAEIMKVLKEANETIFRKSKENEQLEGMGTTVVLASIKDGKATVVNIGDSRAYLVSKKKIEQVSTDHSYVQKLVNEGTITSNEAKKHPMRNVITQALGVGETFEPAIKEITFEKNDCLLLCSDGVSGSLAEEDIQKICTTLSPSEAAEKLCESAVENGAADDVTAIVVQIDR